MSHRLLGSGIALLTLLGVGCHSAPKGGRLPEYNAAQPPAQCPPGNTVRVQLPPQEITLVQPGGEGQTVIPPVDLGTQPKGGPESDRRPGKPESDFQRPPARPRPESDLGAEQEGALEVLGAVSALGQIAGFSRTSAMTRQLGTVDPGSAGLGIGFRWIHIPFPWFRLFSVEETPSITVPLTEANLVAQGGGAMLGGRAAGGGVSREELAALVAQEVARRSANRPRPPAPPAPEDDAERKLLEKKLAAAEEQMERMATTLKALSDKLSAEPAKAPPK